jgi:hypothetical protein
MSRDRTHAVHRPFHLEAVRPKAENRVEHHEGRGRRRPEQVEELSAAHAGERQANTRPSRCVADLDAAKATKPQQATLTAAEHHEAPAQRRNRPRAAR